MRARLIVAATAVAAAVVGGGILLSGPASAVNTTLCDQYASTTNAGGYIVQNNRWGTGSTQCINVTDDGFTVTQQDGVSSTSGAPTSYPSVYWGCHYNNCTNGFSPIQASSTAFAGIGTKVAMTYPTGGNWDAAYDVWFDPTARRDGQNTGAEIMVWLNHSGPPQPVGSKVGTVTTAGGTWDVWYGNSGWNVVSYVRTSAASSVDFKVSDFYNDAVQRGYAQKAWYLTSVQAGFEPWSGGKGLGLSGFAVTQGGSTSAPTATTAAPTVPVVTPTTTTPATSTSTSTSTSPSTSTTAPGTGTGTGAAKCTATYKVTQSWNGGFLGDVTVKNTGGSATKSWKTTWTWPAGQKVVSSWNASSATSGTTVTASSLAYNGAVAASGTTQFGMQVSGASATPKLTCTAS